MFNRDLEIEKDALKLWTSSDYAFSDYLDLYTRVQDFFNTKNLIFLQGTFNQRRSITPEHPFEEYSIDPNRKTTIPHTLTNFEGDREYGRAGMTYNPSDLRQNVETTMIGEPLDKNADYPVGKRIIYDEKNILRVQPSLEFKFDIFHSTCENLRDLYNHILDHPENL